MKWHWGNFLIPHAFGLIAGLMALNPVIAGKRTEYLLATTSVLIGLDGAILGFVIAGFAILASFTNNEMTVFAVTNKRDEDRYSYLKTKLLTVFKSFFWVFTGTAGTVILDALLRYYLQTKCRVGAEFGDTVHSQIGFAAFYLVAYLQAKIFIELKVLIFTLYNSSLTQAKFMAQAAGKKPIDDTND